MDVLENLTPDQRTTIVSLPYRVGLWISRSDATGGGEASEKELIALANIIEGFSEQVFGSELLQYIMNETVSRKKEWPSWAFEVEKAPAECAMALDILRDYVDAKDVNAYATRLMEVAEAVALAFREYEQQSSGDKFRVYASFIKSKWTALFRKGPSKSFDQFLNVSLAERRALGELAKNLGISYSL